MTDPKPVRRGATMLFSVAMVLIGVALIVRTVAAGGGPLASGLILGLLFIAGGAGRAYLGRATR